MEGSRHAVLPPGRASRSAQSSDFRPSRAAEAPDPDATAADPDDTADLLAHDTADLDAPPAADPAPATSHIEVPSEFLAPTPLSASEEDTLAFERRILGTKLAGCILDARIGRGAVGSVFRARHVGLDKEVAVKILNPALFCLRRHVDQFFREARAAASLEHPNIVTVYDVGQHRGLYYIVMQLIHGETLADRIDREGRLEVTEAVRMAIEAANALGAAHRKGIIHRDIKPANLLLTREGLVKVADFGLASRRTDRRDADGKSEVAGTPYYIPPEQITGVAVDHRADLYSLGVTMFFALTGRRPFDGGTPRDILVKHLTLVPPAVTEINPSIPSRLSEIVARLLAKKPQSRPSSAEELVAELLQLSREMAW